MEEHGLARNTDPQTSKDAAMAVNIGNLEGLILVNLRTFQIRGMTTSEIAQRSNTPRDSLSPRMKGLVAKKLIVDSGERRAPTIDDGRRHPKQIVWQITSEGLARIQNWL